jgi:hypothetical protein
MSDSASLHRATRYTPAFHIAPHPPYLGEMYLFDCQDASIPTGALTPEDCVRRILLKAGELLATVASVTRLILVGVAHSSMPSLLM